MCIALEAVKITESRNYNNAYGNAIFSTLNKKESLHCHYEAIHGAIETEVLQKGIIEILLVVVIVDLSVKSVLKMKVKK